jgi:hypothetical protein
MGRVHAKSLATGFRGRTTPTRPSRTPTLTKAFSVKSIVNGTINPSVEGCGIGTNWWNDRKDDDDSRLSDFQIHDLIVKLAHTSFPLTKSMTCKTCQTTHDDSSNEENTRSMALPYNACKFSTIFTC